jgi:hypothetical protein
MRAVLSAHRTFYDLITLVVLGEGYKLCLEMFRLSVKSIEKRTGKPGNKFTLILKILPHAMKTYGEWIYS